MRPMPNSFGLSSRPLASLLFSALLVALAAVPAAAQDVPADGLLLRLQANALETAEVPPELAALATDLQRPMLYTAAVIHPHNGRMSVTISQGTLKEGDVPSRFLNDEAAEFFFYDRVLEENDRDALRDYLAAHYNTAQAEGSEGLNQGVHVQGSWSIEVRDPDGSLQERREFENALTQDGQQTLAEVLGRTSTPGYWTVSLNDLNPETPPPPCESDGDPSACIIREVDGGLMVSVQGASVRLQGSVVAEQPLGQVTRVRTALDRCASSTPPDSPCPPSSSAERFTLSTIDPVGAEQGQSIEVEVTLEFN